MFRNVYFDYRISKIHLWEQIKGKNFYSKENWAPYVWHPTADETEWKSIWGENVVRKTFRSYVDFRDYSKTRTGLYENKIKPEIQYLVDRYFKIDDEKLEVPNLKIYVLDIEVHRDAPGFSKPDKAEDPICLISIYSYPDHNVFSFGTRKLPRATRDNEVYFYCSTELELLTQFFKFAHKSPPDVYTGWNVLGFDLTFIINRCKKIYNSNIYSYLSPIKNVSTWKARNADWMNIDIAGVSILDYLSLYKHFSSANLESYSLDYVAHYELGKGKYDYSKIAEDLRELYHKDWETYVDYNQMDTKRVAQFEDKLGYIGLIQSLSLLTKCPMKYCDKQTSLIEGAMLTYLRRKNICAPEMRGGKKEYFEAAIVKEPQHGQYRWVVDADITSSYPTAMITLNMSNETYVGRIQNLEEWEIIDAIRNLSFNDVEIKKDNKTKTFKGEHLNILLRDKLISIAPNGVIFKNVPKGVIASMEQDFFAKRNDAKKKMIRAAKREDKNKTLKFKNLQISIKNILNSVYGAFSVPYSRYHNLDIAEAITSCGRHFLRCGEQYINDFLNNPSEELKNILKELE